MPLFLFLQFMPIVNRFFPISSLSFLCILLRWLKFQFFIFQDFLFHPRGFVSYLLMFDGYFRILLESVRYCGLQLQYSLGIATISSLNIAIYNFRIHWPIYYFLNVI